MAAAFQSEKIMMGDGAAFNTWDPRREDYDDSKFNSYDKGPGRNLTGRDKGSSKKGVKLYVSNLPLKVTEEGLRHMFITSGNVISVYMRKSTQGLQQTNYGFVEMDSLKSAEAAITEMDMFPIGSHKIRVQIALSQEEKEDRKRKKRADQDFLQELEMNRAASSYYGSDVEGSQRMTNGHGPRRGKGRAEVLDELTDTETIYRRPGINRNGPAEMMTDTETIYRRNALDRNSNASYHPDMSQSSAPGRYPGNNSMDSYQSGYADAMDEMHNNYGGPGYDGNYPPGGAGQGGLLGYAPHMPNLVGGPGLLGTAPGYPWNGPGRGFSLNRGRGGAFNMGRGRGAMDRYGGPGGYMAGPGRGRGNVGYGGGRGYGNQYSPHGQQFPARQMMGRGLNQSYAGPEYHRSTDNLSMQSESKKKVSVPSRPCLKCGRPGTQQCSRCKMPYCSAQCQKQHWEKHKPHCREISNMHKESLENLEERFDVSVDQDFMKQYTNVPSQKTKRDDGSSDSGSQRGNIARQNRSQTENQVPRNHNGPANTPEMARRSDTGPQQERSNFQRNLKDNNQPPARQQPMANQQQNMMGRMQQSPNNNQRSPQNVNTPPRFSFKNMEQARLPLKETSQVFVVYVDDPAHIWVQHANYEQLEKLEKLMDEESGFVKEPVTAPMVGDVYAAKFTDNKWYRVKIVALQAPDSVSVFYIDFGNTATLTYSELRHVKKDLLSLPAQAVLINVSGIRPSQGAEWGTECISALKRSLPLLSVCVFHAEAYGNKGGYSGQLLLSENGPSLKDVLLDAKVVLSSTISDQPTITMVSQMQSVSSEIEMGQELQLYVIDCESPAHIVTQIMEPVRVEKYKTMKDSLDQYLKNSRPITCDPVVGQFIVAKFPEDGNWYRSEVIGVEGSRFKVLYVDFGNKEVVGKDNIRDGCDKFTQLPVQCLTCSLDMTSLDETTVSADVTAMLKSAINGKVLKAIVKTNDGKCVGIDMFNEHGKRISELLKNEILKKEPKQPAITATSEVLPTGGAIEEVSTSFLESCHSFHVMKATMDDNKKDLLRRMFETVTSASEKPAYLSPKVGEIVAAQFSKDMEWYRGRVMTVSPSSCDVVFIDYGNSDTVKLDQVRQLDQQTASVPGLAIHCRLQDVDAMSEPHLTMLSNPTYKVKVIAEKDNFFTVSLEGMSTSSVTSSLTTPTLADVARSEIHAGKLPVIVKDVENPSSIYCQLAESNVQRAAEILTENMRKFYKSDTVKVEDPQVGQLFCVECDGTWCRCVVLERKNIALQVLLVDHGMTTTVSVSDLRQLRPEFMELKAVCIHCALDGIEPVGDSWSKEAIDTTKNIADQPLMLKVMGKEGDIFKVKLSDMEGKNEEVGAILVEANHAKRAVPVQASTAPPIMPTRMRICSLPQDGKDVEAIVGHVQEFDQIYIQLVKGAFDAHHLSQEMNKFYSQSESTFMPGRGEMVAAIFQGDWCRARVDGLKETNIRLFYVDYGNFENVPFSSVKRLDAKFSELPMQAIHCNLAGVNIRNDKAQLTKLTEMISNTKLLISVVSVKGDVFSVKINVEGQDINQVFVEASAESVATSATMTSPEAPNRSGSSQQQALHSAPTLSAVCLPEAGKEVQAVVTDAKNFSTLHMQTMEGFVAVNELMGKLKTWCCDASNPCITPRVGDLVAACFSMDNEWYRARCTNVVANSCEVLFVDYGNTDTLPFNKVKRLASEFLQLPSQAVTCKLHDVTDTKDPEQFVHLQQAIVGKPLNVKVVNNVDGVHSVEISVGDIQVNDMFKTASQRSKYVEIPMKEPPKPDQEIPQAVPETKPPVQESPVPTSVQEVKPTSVAVEPTPVPNTVTWPEGQTGAFCALVESFDSMYLQTLEGLETLCELMAEMNTQCSKDSDSYTPRVGEFVAVFYAPDESWYRARVEEVGSSDCKVFLVDFGNHPSIPLSSVKRLDAQFSSYPCQAVRCSLHGVKQQDSAKVEEFKVSVTNVKLLVNVVKKEGDVCSVLIYVEDVCINDKFKDTVAMVAEQSSQAPIAGPTSNTAGNYQTAELTLNISVDAVALHIESLDSITVQTVEGFQGLAPIMENIHTYCTESKESIVPSKGDLVCVCFSEDNTWYRARVEDIKDNMCRVFFLDYGNSDTVTFSKLRKLPNEHLMFPIQGIQCCLANVSTQNRPESVAKLKEMISNTLLSVKAIRKEDNRSVIEITVEGKLINEEFKLPVTPQVFSHPPMTRSYQTAELTMNTAVDAVAIHIEGLDSITVQTVEGFQGLAPIMENIHTYCTESKESLVPSKGDLVCACFSEDNTWYRARVEDVKDNMCRVFFLDYGNSDTVPFSKLKKLPNEHLMFPIQGIQCCLANVSTQNRPENVAKLKEMISNTLLSVKAIGRENNRSVIEITVEGKLINDEFKLQATPSVLSHPPMTRSYQTAELTMNTAVDAVAIHIEGLDSITVQTVEGIQGLAPIMENIHTFCTESRESVVPSKGDLVCACFSEDNTWYRARVEDVKDNMCRVFFLDYGNSDTVPFSKLKKLPNEHLMFPIQGIQCCLANVSTQNSPESAAKLKEMISNTLLSVKAVGKKSNRYQVEISVEGKVINEKFRVEDLPDLAKAELPLDGSPVDAVGLHVDEFDSIYVQTLIGMENLQTVMVEINNHCSNGGSPVEAKAGDMVCAMFSQDNSWYRAKVIEVKAEGVKVFFVDYGNTDVVQPQNIKKLEAKFRALPSQGIKVSLNRVTIRQNEEMLHVLKETLINRPVTLKVVKHEAESFMVEVEVEGIKVNDVFIQEMDMTETATLTHDTPVTAIVVDIQDFDSIYIQTIEGLAAVMTLMEELNDVCTSSGETVLPSVDQLVAAHYNQDNQWYRAKVSEVTSTSCKVSFVDYGNTEVVELAKIKKLDDKFKKLPLQAVKVSLSGVNIHKNPEQLQVLQMKVANVPISVTATSFDGKAYSVTMVVEGENSSVNEMFASTNQEGEDEEDEDEAAIRRQIEQLQLKLAKKAKK